MLHFLRRGRGNEDRTGCIDINTLYSASLEFGAQWCRPLDELAAERLPHRSGPELADMVMEVSECRRAIEDHILNAYLANEREWRRVHAEAADRWIRSTYPWMSRRNRRHAISQGLYYAWHE